MTTSRKKLVVPNWARPILETKLFDWLGADSVPLALSFAGLMAYVIVIGLVGSMIATWGIYLFHLPEIIGGSMAGWCVERGACNFETNLVSIALGVYLSIAIGVFLIFVIVQAVRPAPQSRQSIYYDVLDEITEASTKGASAADIAKRCGHDIVDVYTMLGFMFSGGEIEVIDEPPASKFARYRLIQNERTL